MAQVKVTLSADLITLPGRIDRRIGAARRASANLLEINVKGQIIEVGAVASKDLLNSVDLLAFRDDFVSVGSAKPQAYFVEHGRKPGPVPRWSVFKPILRAWADAKGLAIPDSALYPIALKIRREGFKGRFPFEKAARISEPQIVRVFNRAFENL